MTKREAATLVFKIAAVTIFARHVWSLGSIFSSNQPDVAIGVTLQLLVAVALWFGAKSTAGRIFPTNERTPIEQIPSLANMGVSLIGLWVVVHAISDTLHLLISLLSEPLGFGSVKSTTSWWHLFVAGTQLLIGVWLLLRPRSVVQLARIQDTS